MSSQTAKSIRSSITALDQAIDAKYKAVDDGEAQVKQLNKDIQNLQDNISKQKGELESLRSQKTNLEQEEQRARRLEQEADQIS